MYRLLLPLNRIHPILDQLLQLVWIGIVSGLAPNDWMMGEKHPFA